MIRTHASEGRPLSGGECYCHQAAILPSSCAAALGRCKYPRRARSQLEPAHHPLLDPSHLVTPALRQDRIVGNETSHRQIEPASFVAHVENRDDPFGIELPAHGDHAVSGPEKPERSAAQCGPLSSQGDQPLKFVQKISVPAFGFVPGKSTAIGRVVAPRHPDLIAVID